MFKAICVLYFGFKTGLTKPQVSCILKDTFPLRIVFPKYTFGAKGLRGQRSSLIQENANENNQIQCTYPNVPNRKGVQLQTKCIILQMGQSNTLYVLILTLLFKIKQHENIGITFTDGTKLPPFQVFISNTWKFNTYVAHTDLKKK